MLQILFFPFYLMFYMMILPFKILGWMIKTSIKLTLFCFFGMLILLILLL